MPSQFFHAQIPHPNSSNHSVPNLSPTSPKWCSPNQQNINFVNTPCLKRKDTSSILLFIIQMYISQPFSVLLKTEIETWSQFWDRNLIKFKPWISVNLPIYMKSFICLKEKQFKFI